MKPKLSVIPALAGTILLGGLVLPIHSLAAEPKQPGTALPVFTNVTPAEVDAFLARWNPVFKEQASKEFGFLRAMDQMLKAETNATRLLNRLLGAMQREPQGLWVSGLKMLSQPAGGTTLPPVQLLGAWKQACATLEKAAQAAPKDELIREELAQARQGFVAACLDTGRDLGDAQVAARQMLASTTTNSWNYGNVVYDAHSALGRIALQKGDRATARQELRAAGRTPGSPQLNSFGPQFTLARVLLEQAQPADREAVVAFLDDVVQFWANLDKAPAYRRDGVLKQRQKIENWKEEIRAGKIPSPSDPMDQNRWR
ncbi:MAG TPA: hypothetical protein P5205_14805 [Candidatus Paceibacterota bacterium]|nr:hypothetical protein [Verrucomicrobiota bacterium]HSA11631.1 hypothetical protein [Candidatus Paceibacterota bacterium]